MVHACSITRREEKRLGSIPRSNEQTSNVLQIKKRLQSHIWTLAALRCLEEMEKWIEMDRKLYACICKVFQYISSKQGGAELHGN